MNKVKWNLEEYNGYIRGDYCHVIRRNFIIETNCKHFKTAVARLLKNFPILDDFENILLSMYETNRDTLTNEVYTVDGLVLFCYSIQYDILPDGYIIRFSLKECTKVECESTGDKYTDTDIKDQFGETDATLVTDHAREYMPLDSNLRMMFGEAYEFCRYHFNSIGEFLKDALNNGEYKLSSLKSETIIWWNMISEGVPYSIFILREIIDYIYKIKERDKAELNANYGSGGASIPGMKNLADILPDLAPIIELNRVTNMYRDLDHQHHLQKYHNIADALERILFYANGNCDMIPYRNGDFTILQAMRYYYEHLKPSKNFVSLNRLFRQIISILEKEEKANEN